MFFPFFRLLSSKKSFFGKLAYKCLDQLFLGLWVALLPLDALDDVLHLRGDSHSVHFGPVFLGFVLFRLFGIVEEPFPGFENGIFVLLGGGFCEGYENPVLFDLMMRFFRINLSKQLKNRKSRA